MRKATWLMLGLALVASSAGATAQEIRKAPAPGYIGIRFEEQAIIIMPGAAEKNKSSVIVRDVSKDSPAERAGLRAGDEILRINGMSVANGKFSAVARTLTAGDTVKLRIKRDDKERDYTVVAAARPAGYHPLVGDRTIVFSADSVRGLMRMYLDSARLHLDSLKLPRILVHPGDSSLDIRIERFGNSPFDTLIFRRDSAGMRELRQRIRVMPGDAFPQFEGEMGPGVIFRSMELGRRSIAGAEFTELDPAMKSYFGTDRGLLTLRVAPETPAARAGLVPGDIVQKANGREVTAVGKLRDLLFEEPASLKLEVLRKGERKSLEIQTKRGKSDD
jgi:membrane-associated protease RseP (regulator of RpoE activity)